MSLNITSYLWLLLISLFAFYAYYLFVLFGLKIFKIENVSKKKVAVYLLSILIRVIIFIYAGKFVDFTNNFIHFGIYLINFAIDIVLFRYYFLLTGKKLWQLFLYFVSISLVLVIMNKLPLLLIEYSLFWGIILKFLFPTLFIFFVFWMRKKV